MARPKKQPKYSLNEELMAMVKALSLTEIKELETYIMSLKKGKVEAEIKALQCDKGKCEMRLKQLNEELAELNKTSVNI